ncbi:MAG: TauD/TfdA family dioxygenase [Polyangiaceae bacterium]
MAYRSLVRQTLHYFARPHAGLPSGPIESPAAWRAKELAAEPALRLSAEETQEIERAVDRVLGKRTALAKLRRQDFDWPDLEARARGWRSTLDCGSGVVLIRGLPTTRWSEQQCEAFFWGLGLTLGVPGAQNPEGHLLGHVRDEREDVDAVAVRQYRTRAHIPFHCDAADVVGLLCVKAAKHGGESAIASSVSVFNELWRRDPALCRRLFEPYFLDTKAEGGLRAFPITPARHVDGVLRTFYHSDYFRTAPRHREVPALDERSLALLDAYDEIASSDEFCLRMRLEPGDVQLISNHFVVHSRTAYEDHEDPAERRHLLRLWLSLPHRPSLLDRVRTERARFALLADLARHRWRQRGS